MGRRSTPEARSPRDVDDSANPSKKMYSHADIQRAQNSSARARALMARAGASATVGAMAGSDDTLLRTRFPKGRRFVFAIGLRRALSKTRGGRLALACGVDNLLSDAVH
mmetsp:Transcript_106121/g.305109  ORF Transcript_106121/g.305109 Transcript_106121/m.305109 type:complete len:109 (-) Transcript_106121:1302-1628(-)|eukprot:CAMPEP_0170406616 /NCGR_PEP_ID=MMETSP0117_2-20130122/27815_1 /TAXON_ID=400756 /ORGANISM="Durinskia baltica, Strain CSIRO CS-38" /LENGTH=108 /DNA_ID=CAMNT_0010663821 /DNA_START=68 /DNA_END=394 /DNA_ORIENTATION=-